MNRPDRKWQAGDRSRKIGQTAAVFLGAMAILAPMAEALRPSPEESARLANIKAQKFASSLTSKISAARTSVEILRGTPENRELVRLEANFESHSSSPTQTHSTYQFAADVNVGEDQRLSARNVRGIYVAVGDNTSTSASYAMTADDGGWNLSARYKTASGYVEYQGVTAPGELSRLIDGGPAERLIDEETFADFSQQLNGLFEKGLNAEALPDKIEPVRLPG